ncbi:MAG TPA: translation initiation factor IF-3, partial [Candidatus Limnocylindrales bacterium]|nr:translation initiation factor IF-3 [Candidatus Limnocylindrales bacterium]
MAQERGFDLVEVAPMAAPPVVRFLDFGQYKYELTKREKEAKRRQRVGFKEVRLTPKIGSGDFQTKVHRAIEFLEEGDRIKVTVRFRGRELTHPELGRNLLTKFAEAVKEHGTLERAPVLEGKSMFIVMASVHKPKVHEARPAPGGRDAEGAPAATAAAASSAAAAPRPVAPVAPVAPAAPAEAPQPATAPAARNVTTTPAARKAAGTNQEPAPTQGAAAAGE